MMGVTLRCALSVVASLAIAGFAAAAEAPPCSTWPGARVYLASDPADPQVFLWDSRDRLIAYAAGQWGSARAIFAHTMLAEPGTQALAVSCYHDVAKPRDAIGVKVLNGPFRGRYVWVLSSDVHLIRSGSTAPARAAHT